MWITSAKRPLSTEELRHALGVELDSIEFDGDNLPDLEDMVSSCCGLVTTDEESQIIRLIHYTAQEYFDRVGSSLFPSANSQIAETCVTYLNYDVFLDGPCYTGDDVQARLELYSQYKYASDYWGIHASSASNYEFCYGFLSAVMKVRACRQAMLHRKRNWWENFF